MKQRAAVEFEQYYADWERWVRVRAFLSDGGGLRVEYEDAPDRENVGAGEDSGLRAGTGAHSEGVMAIGADGTILGMNGAASDLLQRSATVGQSLQELIASGDRDLFQLFHERICKGEHGTAEIEFIGAGGERRCLELDSAPLRWPDSSTVHLAVARDVTERHNRDRAALLLGAIVDSSDDAIVSKDLNGIVMSWNKSAERLFGFTASEMIGHSILKIIPSDRQSEETDILARLKRGERVDHFETIRQRKDGMLLDISLTISPVRDRNGRIVGASKIARDVTERKRGERAIQDLNSRLMAELAVMNRMQHLSTRVVEAGNVAELLCEILEAGLEFTSAARGTIQLPEGDVLKTVAQRGFGPGSSPMSTVHKGSGAAGAAWMSARRMIVEDLAESPLFANDPRREVLLEWGVRALQSTPLISRAGKVLGVLSTYFTEPGAIGERELRLLDLLARQAADLIDRVDADKARRASESRFRQLAEAMPQIVWTARPDGCLDYGNQRWYEFTGLSRELDDDTVWMPITHPDDAVESRERWDDSVKTGEPFQIDARFWDRKDQCWRWFICRALAVRGADGAVEKWFGTCTDIDEHKHVLDELRRANTDLEQFAYSASHDLQEPLRTITVYAELLESRYRGKLDGQALEFLEHLRAGARRMEMLVRDLLEYTQVARMEATPGAADSEKALEAVLENLSGAIEQSGARITHDPLPRVPAHSTHIQQLFQNLIGNAIKYRHPDRAPEVHVSVQRHSGNLIFSVRDNGIGIPPEYKEQIFGLFKRLHTGDQYSGTGIGLAICQRIVDRYHGRIWVESEPGKSSAFHFALPV